MQNESRFDYTEAKPNRFAATFLAQTEGLPCKSH